MLGEEEQSLEGAPSQCIDVHVPVPVHVPAKDFTGSLFTGSLFHWVFMTSGTSTVQVIPGKIRKIRKICGSREIHGSRESRGSR